MREALRSQGRATQSSATDKNGRGFAAVTSSVSAPTARTTWETTKGSCDAAGRDAAFWHVGLRVRTKFMYFGSGKTVTGYSL